MKTGSYYAACNPILLEAVPASAKRILDVGCGSGALGAALKARDPDRQVFGVERAAAAAAEARAVLDAVYVLDIAREGPPIEEGSLDCITFGDVLEHVYDPREVLQRLRRLLRPEGCVVCSIPNLQHHSIIRALLQGEFQYTEAGLMDSTHVRFFTYSTMIKLLVDSGFRPSFVDWNRVDCPERFVGSARPLLDAVGVDPERAAQYMGALHFVFKGVPLDYLDDVSVAAPVPLSFVVCCNDDVRLNSNLLASPCFAPGHPHEILFMRECETAAEGLNAGIQQARHELVVCVHQDVYLPEFWPARFVQQFRLAKQRFGRIGVAGVFGADREGREIRYRGQVLSWHQLLEGTGELPARVDTLDELLLAVERDGAVRFDPRLGFHLYGADACLTAREQGTSAVVLDALCYHNTLQKLLPDSFYVSGSAFARKWRSQLPVAAPCAFLDEDWCSDEWVRARVRRDRIRATVERQARRWLRVARAFGRGVRDRLTGRGGA